MATDSKGKPHWLGDALDLVSAVKIIFS